MMIRNLLFMALGGTLGNVKNMDKPRKTANIKRNGIVGVMKNHVSLYL
ncbi:MAG: hypothetical protein MR536_04510 [Prevotella sp.]|nr:hypothetical protein [Prevotella sp.]MDD7461216.1 hypothetical protein [Prevotellaceae bacterium]MDY3366059.1 hypothetical protein [Prevotella sp.]MDY3852333.1 hypothetical protein [Prevotella sp.]